MHGRSQIENNKFYAFSYRLTLDKIYIDRTGRPHHGINYIQLPEISSGGYKAINCLLLRSGC